jgi:hypothetical protein
MTTIAKVGAGWRAVSIMRGFLRSGLEPTTVMTQQFQAPLVNPLVLDGWNSNNRALSTGL